MASEAGLVVVVDDTEVRMRARSRGGGSSDDMRVRDAAKAAAGRAGARHAAHCFSASELVDLEDSGEWWFSCVCGAGHVTLILS